MLYTKKNDPGLREELFRNPTAEYRGAPFWGWTGRVDRERLLEQIPQFAEMGMGGAHLHARGISDPEYLSGSFMELIDACHREFQKRGMYTWLYDENMCPSGFAGGLVSLERRFRQRYLELTPVPDDSCAVDRKTFEFSKEEEYSGYYLAHYAVELDGMGKLSGYRRLRQYEREKHMWYAYLKLVPCCRGENTPYVDTLNPEALIRFVELTHEKYRALLGENFGKDVPAIFTDEPQFYNKGRLGRAKDRKPVRIPFTDNLEETYQKTYGESLLERLPELFWESPSGELSAVRYQYHDHTAERFALAFADTLGKWCQKNNLVLTGHMMSEPELGSQTRATGEAMRSFRSFQMPGIDMLCDKREFSTAKQAQSAAHQYGREGVMSELYGVTNWDFDFKRHKLQGDWQAAMGVTLRVPHLTWATMEGEGKRDFPASIGYQSTWYREYSCIEDHFARVNTAMTRGKACVRIGVIHPVESYWMYYGCVEHTQDKCRELEDNFQNIIEWLLFAQQDFDFISESLLPAQFVSSDDKKFHIGGMSYDAVLIPNCVTLRSTTIDALRRFSNGGGKVIFAGAFPEYMDGKKSGEIAEFAKKECACIPFSQYAILRELEPYREISLSRPDGSRPISMVYQLRQDGEDRWLFLSHSNLPGPERDNWMGDFEESEAADEVYISIKGQWQGEVYDTMTGKIYSLPGRLTGTHTNFCKKMYSYDSLLIRLFHGTVSPENKNKAEAEDLWETRTGMASVPMLCGDGIPVTLSEPNVLLLDLAQWRCMGEKEWRPLEDILKIQNILERKKELWPGEKIVELKFLIYSENAIEGAMIALERPEEAEIFLNDQQVTKEDQGWFVDKSIRKLPLPLLIAGENHLVLRYPFRAGKFIEWSYLLGDFSVSVKGYKTKLGPPVNKLFFGDWTTQGLPFYAGNVTYHCQFPVEKEGKEMMLQFPRFANPLLTVVTQDGEKQQVIIPPYLAHLGQSQGKNMMFEVTAYGNRINAFGSVHNPMKTYQWFGKEAWFTQGSSYSYEYCLKPMGILQSPIIWKKDSEK